MDCSPPGSSVYGFSRQKYWSELPFPPLWDLPNPEIESRSSTLQADSLPTKPPGKPSEVYGMYIMSHFNSLINIRFLKKRGQRDEKELLKAI